MFQVHKHLVCRAFTVIPHENLKYRTQVVKRKTKTAKRFGVILDFEMHFEISIESPVLNMSKSF